MLKQIIAALFVSIVLSIPAIAIEPPAGAKIPYEGKNVAYTSAMFNEVLEAYGLNLTAEAAKNVPSNYAKVDGDKVIFTDKPFAFRPDEYHSILSAYGLTLTPEEVSAKLAGTPIPYATVEGDKVVLGKKSAAFTPEEWQTILSAYSLAM